LAKISAAVTIGASPAAVWAVLCDLGHYPEWHPAILKAEGEIQAGGQVAFTETVQRRTSTHLVRVETAQPEAELRWRPVRSSSCIETSFMLSPIDSGTHTKVVYSLIFRGLWVPVFWMGLLWIPAPWAPLRVLMRKVNQGLKHRAEHAPGTQERR
jgi:hypothetical protein